MCRRRSSVAALGEAECADLAVSADEETTLDFAWAVEPVFASAVSSGWKASVGAHLHSLAEAAEAAGSVDRDLAVVPAAVVEVDATAEVYTSPDLGSTRRRNQQGQSWPCSYSECFSSSIAYMASLLRISNANSHRLHMLG